MTRLEDLTAGAKVSGIIPDQRVIVVDVKWHGQAAIELFYKRADGQTGSQLVYRSDEAFLEIGPSERTWSFDADGATFRLAAEAYRIRLAHLFDPVLAVHTSLIEPLPHQITAVYGEMLIRQPLRYLLADDPGAGKTIMAGLLIRELIIRGDVRRCLICVPGNLAAQWQDELFFKFHTRFDILTREVVEASVTGNPFLEQDRVIVRLDQIARSDELQDKLHRTDWDLIICDEAHKMAASFFGGELKETKRYRLGRLLSRITRHFLLMTATPHNGKEEDFQLFLALIDPDRFEGRFRDGVHEVDVSDIMRRMIKEQLLKFDGRPLFPERRAYTMSYPLSSDEAQLYGAVTDYVREEFNRAEQLANESHRGTVGFALTVLQRRLASSPEAIYQSIRRRRERLEKRLAEEQLLNKAAQEAWFDHDEIEDLDDAPADELEAVEEQVIDSATAAQTIAELKIEITTLKRLEEMAYHLRHLGTDRKWEELAKTIQDDERMFGPEGQRDKVVIFTEHRDTLNYLWERITTLFGREDCIVYMHGGQNRDERRSVEDRFRNDPSVTFLIATDAAGEGINLQRAHLMINYDLPWNPNRLEQRFGRIHRIGQTEVCHLWNLVAGETREGHVYERLLEKIREESKALKGQVFDVLGQLFEGTSLREILTEAIRYGDSPEVRARLEQAIDNAIDREKVRELIERRSLAQDAMDLSAIQIIRAEMERASARRLQPHYIKSFFMQAFAMLGGSIREREAGRFQISRVPAAIRTRSREIGTPLPVLDQYERVCFEKTLINVPGQPLAEFICPGHQLLDTVIDLTLQKYRDALRSGAVLIDPTDPGNQPRALFFLEQSIHDAHLTPAGEQRVVSREVHFVEINSSGDIRSGGRAPYLDYRPATEDETAQIGPLLEAEWLAAEGVEAKVLAHAIEHLAKAHLDRVRQRREALIDKTLAAVQERLTKEINYWDARAATLRSQEKAGRNARLNSQLAQQRADELAARLGRRKEELSEERQIAASPPVIIGGALIVPIGLLLGEHTPPELADKKVTEAIAMHAVMEAEVALGNSPSDVSARDLGYDIESLDPRTGRLRFIEVKGRRAGADTVTITRNEILTAINTPEGFILAIVEVEGGQGRTPRYVRQPFDREPDFSVTSVNYNIKEAVGVERGACIDDQTRKAPP